jgi:hypothetical protein
VIHHQAQKPKPAEAGLFACGQTVAAISYRAESAAKSIPICGNLCNLRLPLSAFDILHQLGPRGATLIIPTLQQAQFALPNAA